MRLPLVEWAESNGLTYVEPRRRCLNWVRAGRCAVRQCHIYQGDGLGLSGVWDHPTAWKLDGRAAVIIVQPYGYDEQSHRADLERVAEQYGLVLRQEGQGWYGHGTTLHGFWWPPALERVSP